MPGFLGFCECDYVVAQENGANAVFERRICERCVNVLLVSLHITAMKCELLKLAQ